MVDFGGMMWHNVFETAVTHSLTVVYFDLFWKSCYFDEVM